MSVLTFINKLKTYGFGDTRVLGTTYGCPAATRSTQRAPRMVQPYLKSSDDWTMLSHGSKACDKHRAKSGTNGLWTQSKFVVSELQAGSGRRGGRSVTARRLRADEMIAAQLDVVSRGAFAEGPAGDVVPGICKVLHAPGLPARRAVRRPGHAGALSWGRSVRRAPRISFEGVCPGPRRVDDAFPEPPPWLHARRPPPFLAHPPLRRSQPADVGVSHVRVARLASLKTASRRLVARI